MIDIITNIGWVLAAAVVGTVALVLMSVVVFGPIIGLIFLVENKIGQSAWWRKRRPSQRAKDMAGGTFVALLFLTLVTMIGLAALDESYDSFGWPPVPDWIDSFGDTKKKDGC